MLGIHEDLPFRDFHPDQLRVLVPSGIHVLHVLSARSESVKTSKTSNVVVAKQKSAAGLR